MSESIRLMLPEWVGILFTALVGFISAVVLGYLTGQWGGFRRAERVADLLSKVHDPYLTARLRERLKKDLDRELVNLDRKVPLGVRLAAGVVYSVVVLLVLLGGITRGQTASGVLNQTGLIDALGRQSRQLSEQLHLSGQRLLTAQVVLDALLLIFVACWFSLVFWVVRSLERRPWGPQDDPAPTRLTTAEVFDGLVVFLQVLFLLVTVLPALVGVVLAL